jgi:hypothetical protein
MACERTLTKRKRKTNVWFKNRATGDMHEHGYARRLPADLTKIEAELTRGGPKKALVGALAPTQIFKLL